MKSAGARAKEPQTLPLACLDSPVWRALPSSGALPQEEASLWEGRPKTRGFLSGTYLGVYPPPHEPVLTMCARGKHAGLVPTQGWLHWARWSRPNSVILGMPRRGRPHLGAGQRSAKLSHSGSKSGKHSHPSISCMILPQKYPIEPGGQNVSLREVPAIGTKSEGLGGGGTLEPTSLSHRHTRRTPFPDLSLLQSETHRLGCLDNGLRNAEGVPPASSLPSPAQGSIQCVCVWGGENEQERTAPTPKHHMATLEQAPGTGRHHSSHHFSQLHRLPMPFRVPRPRGAFSLSVALSVVLS